MLQKKREHTKEKPGLHSRNRHRERYNFKELVSCNPGLDPFVIVNDYGEEWIDFSKTEAVLMLNKALLKCYYGIDYWNIPPGYLCPPVPGRADYIHHLADLLSSNFNGIIPLRNDVRCLDIGIGANCIYPIIGNMEYGWSFVGTDIDPVALKSASGIIENNPRLKENVELRLQPHSKDIFRGIIKKDEYFDLTVCNPPFHASLEEAQSGTLRKLSNLNRKRIGKPTLNFGGQNIELCCEGGEEKFIRDMISQSRQFSHSCFWFTSLVSKQAHLKSIYSTLKYVEAIEVRTIPMSQGNKTSRIVAWIYLTKEQQKKWINKRWTHMVEDLKND